jgi:hypothetical protein
MSQTIRRMKASDASDMGALGRKKGRHGTSLGGAQQQPTVDYRDLLTPETRASLDEFVSRRRAGGATDGDGAG